MQQLTTNTLLHGGTYRIEKVLGQGSFGITYLGVHTSLDRKVAIKEFFMKELNSRSDDGSITGLTDGSLSFNYARKFKKEAQNLARLEHPNIVRVTDCFDENGTFYYVMDYIEGENLNDYIKHQHISQEEAISIITDVAKALQYMHEEKHMLHLDLKPGNVMRRSSDGHIFLIDFGLSKHYSSDGQPETSTTIGLGTAGYAPIEQANQAKNGEFRPTIDVYALGATLYKLLTHQTPPAASDVVSDDEIIEDGLCAAGITGNVIEVVTNAMMPSVKKRTQNVRDFLNSINNTTSKIATSQPKPVAESEETTIFAQPESISESTHVVELSPINEHKPEEITLLGKLSKNIIPVLIIAGIVFVYDFICYCIKYMPQGDYMWTYFTYGIAHNILEATLFVCIGSKIIRNDKLYPILAIVGVLLWLCFWFVDWNANYIWSIGGALTDNAAQISQFFNDMSQYGGLVLMIAFGWAIFKVKRVSERFIFFFLLLYASEQFIPHYLNTEDLNSQYLGLFEYTVLLVAVALTLWYVKKGNQN